jgi:hypothetical protein
MRMVSNLPRLQHYTKICRNRSVNVDSATPHALHKPSPLTHPTLIYDEDVFPDHHSLKFYVDGSTKVTALMSMLKLREWPLRRMTTAPMPRTKWNVASVGVTRKSSQNDGVSGP